MARHSDLWLRARDRFWMTTLNGKQVKLSRDKGEARRFLHKLLAADAPAKSTGVACRRLLDTYLQKTAADKSAGRVKVQTTYFKQFCAAFGHRRADALKPFEVNDWLDALDLADSTKALVLSMLKAGFSWGQREGYFPQSPLAQVKKRKMARRERMLTPEEVASVLGQCRPRWREFFTVLHLTGMRPRSEAAALEACHLDHERRRAVLAKHKNQKKTGKPRVVYFPAQAWVIVARLAAEYPAGPLFRNRDGKALNHRSMREYLHAACGRAGVKPFPVYTIRHAMLTEALGRGVPIEVLAQLAGNSPHVIRENYAKLGDDIMADVLAKAAEQAAG